MWRLLSSPGHLGNVLIETQHRQDGAFVVRAQIPSRPLKKSTLREMGMWSPGKMTVFLSTGSWCGLNQHRSADPCGVMPVHEWALQSVIFHVQNRPKSGGRGGQGGAGCSAPGAPPAGPGTGGRSGRFPRFPRHRRPFLSPAHRLPPPARLPAAPRRLKRLAERAGAPRPLLRRRDCATRGGGGGLSGGIWGGHRAAYRNRGESLMHSSNSTVILPARAAAALSAQRRKRIARRAAPGRARPSARPPPPAPRPPPRRG